jgi:hypothetical protein
MKDVLSIFSGISVIAHILPGSLIIVTVLWFSSKDFEGLTSKVRLVSGKTGESIGFAFLFLIVASILGLILDGIRSTIPDNLIHQWFNITFPKDAYYSLFRPGSLEVPLRAHEDYFRYYQFYVNTVIVATGWTVGSLVRIIRDRKSMANWLVLIVSALLSYGLLKAAVKALKHFYRIIELIGNNPCP